MPETAAIVTSLLAAAGMAPDPDEIAALVEDYPGLRADADALYRVEGLADVAPLLAFSLTPYAD